jgi:hypothetical protein
LNGINNASEQAIGRSKERYKMMRGYKSMDGMKNDVVLTRWQYSREDEQDLLAEVVAAGATSESLPEPISRIRPPFVEQLR